MSDLLASGPSSTCQPRQSSPEHCVSIALEDLDEAVIHVSLILAKDGSYAFSANLLKQCEHICLVIMS